MKNLIVDATRDKIFLTLIVSENIYTGSYENSKINFEKLMILINEFLSKNKNKLDHINAIYVNRGPGSFAGIRNSLSTIKALFLTRKIDYYCFSFEDFDGFDTVKYEDFESHQEAYKVFSKSIESIKRKQVEQEFSNGKGDNKKKKFDFHGEMKKFSQDQQRTIENVTDTVQTVAKVANTAQNVNKAIDQLKGETLENIEMDVIEEGVAEENKENKENKVDDGGEGKKEE